MIYIIEYKESLNILHSSKMAIKRLYSELLNAIQTRYTIRHYKQKNQNAFRTRQKH